MSIGANSITEHFTAFTVGNINGQGSYTHAGTWVNESTGSDTATIAIPTGLDKRIKLWSNSNTTHGGCNLTLNSGYRPYTGYIQMAVAGQSGNYAWSWLSIRNSAGTELTAIGLDNAYNIVYWAGGAWHSIGTFSYGIYKALKIAFNTSTGKASFYIGGVLKASNVTIGTGQVYSIRLTTSNGGNYPVLTYWDDLEFSGDAVVTTPTAPSGLTATSVSTSQINLSWTDNATDETGFKIEESTDGSSDWTQVDTVGTNVTTYPRTGLDSGTKTYYRVRAYNSAGNSSYSNTAYATTDSALLSGSSSITVSSSIAYSRSRVFSESSIITVATSIGDAGVGASATSDYQYYLGSYNGKVFAENKDYKSDAGQKINSYWLSKQTDFADEDITCLGKFKTVYGMQLWYKDIETDVPVTVGISTNGGVTWETQTKTFGTADDKEKTALYYFIVTGNIFQFKIQNDSDTKTFQWTALKALYTIGGDFFEIN